MAEQTRRPTSRSSRSKARSAPRRTKTSRAKASRAKTSRAKTSRAKTSRAKTSRAKTSRAKTSRAKTSRARTSQAGRSRTAPPAKSPRKWSKRVTERSDALDLKQGVFELKDPRAIARSLKRSAEHSRRRKSEPYRSAMSMLTFYVNRAGRNLPASRKKVLQQAKDELRRAFGRA
jgi:Protein of unknown function (DUF3175)